MRFREFFKSCLIAALGAVGIWLFVPILVLGRWSFVEPKLNILIPELVIAIAVTVYGIYEAIRGVRSRMRRRLDLSKVMINVRLVDKATAALVSFHGVTIILEDLLDEATLPLVHEAEAADGFLAV